MNRSGRGGTQPKTLPKRVHASSQNPSNKKQEATVRPIRNSKQLNDVFQENSVVPKIHHIEGKPRSVIDTGLDSHL